MTRRGLFLQFKIISVYNFFPTEKGGLFLGVIYFPFEKMMPDWLWFEKIPFPFFMYQYHDDDLVLNFGLPMFFRWKINSDWTCQVFYIPIYNIRSSLEWSIRKWLVPGVEFAWLQKTVYLSERTLPDEKVYFNSKNIGLKLRLFYFIELKAGYSFDTSFYKGEKVSDYHEKVKLKNSFYYTVSFSYAF